MFSVVGYYTIGTTTLKDKFSVVVTGQCVGMEAVRWKRIAIFDPMYWPRMQGIPCTGVEMVGTVTVLLVCSGRICCALLRGVIFKKLTVGSL